MSYGRNDRGYGDRGYGDRGRYEYAPRGYDRGYAPPRREYAPPPPPRAPRELPSFVVDLEGDEIVVKLDAELSDCALEALGVNRRRRSRTAPSEHAGFRLTETDEYIVLHLNPELAQRVGSMLFSSRVENKALLAMAHQLHTKSREVLGVNDEFQALVNELQDVTDDWLAEPETV